MSHTPGPWITEEASDKRIEISSSCNFGIADVWALDGQIPHEEMRANARLIAAAPELIEACQTFAEWLRREDEGFCKAGKNRDTQEGEAAWREWFDENLRICSLAQSLALAAIAKATNA